MAQATHAPGGHLPATAAPAPAPDTADRRGLPLGGRKLPSWAFVWGPALIPALAMLLVGRYRLNNPSIGWDESATWAVSQRTPEQILFQASHFDGVIAPYYLFMHFWTSIFGDSPLAMRAPSLIAVTIAAGLAGELGRRLFSPGVGLLGGLFFVAVPLVSRYAQDARAYGLALMFAMLAMLLFHRALAESSWRRWVAYGVVVVFLGFSHIFALLLLVGHAYAIGTRWWADRDRTLLRWVAVTAVAVVPVLPLIWLGLTQRGDQLAWIPAMDVGRAMNAPANMFGSAAAGLLVIGLALSVRWPEHRLLREAAVLVVAPPVLLIGVSFVTSSVWVARYVLFTVPVLCLLAAAALRGLRLRGVLVLVLLAFVAMPAHKDYRGKSSHDGPDFRAVAAYLVKHQLPGDAIVYGPDGGWALRAAMDYQLPAAPRPRDVLLSRPAAEIGQLMAEQCPDQVACLGTAKRVWLFTKWDKGDPLDDAGPLATTFARDYRQAELKRFPKASLVLFERL